METKIDNKSLSTNNIVENIIKEYKGKITPRTIFIVSLLYGADVASALVKVSNRNRQIQ